MTRLGVAGWPVGHSRSPTIQNAALNAVGLDGWRYQLLPLPPQLFEETVSALPDAGFRGINVTIPHKERALALALAAGGELSDRARTIGAVNTLVFEAGGGILADNTDAPAFTAALSAALEGGEPDGGGVRGVTALVLGAGGSARAAAWALLEAGAAEVRVWNRTAARARALCESLAHGLPGRGEAGDPPGSRPRIVAVGRTGPADVLVNCTSVGLRAHGAEQLSELPVAADLPYRAVVDFVYRAGETSLISSARARGIATVDGLELLVGQGALSFELFTGRAAPHAAMRTAAGLSSAR